MIGFGGNSCSGGISSMDMMMNIDDTNNNNNRKVIPSISVVSHNNSGAQNRRVSVLNMANHQDHHNNNTCSSSNIVRDKIMAHPLFPRLLSSYLNCLKVGAPPEVVARLEELSAKCESSSSIHHHHHHHVTNHKMSNGGSTIGGIGEVDPGLDQFMEAYCEMLIKYEQELTKPFKEAMLFFSRIESQLKALSLSSSSTLDHFGHNHHHHQSESSSLHHNNSNEVDENNNMMMMMDTQLLSEERELKIQLLRKYSGYLGGLKKEFLKKKKNGKLPKEARQQLLDWWSRHYKWPYPSESQKQALAESTGLDLKQINNWFINQRKRHWKPSEDMQFAVMDATNHYIETIMCKPFPIDAMPVLF